MTPALNLSFRCLLAAAAAVLASILLSGCDARVCYPGNGYDPGSSRFVGFGADGEWSGGCNEHNRGGIGGH